MTAVVGAGICVIIAYVSAKVTYQDFQTDRVIPIYLQVPAGAVNIIIAIGYVALFLQFCRNICDNFRGVGAGVPPDDTADDASDDAADDAT
jgi:TRAP-type C4-dicarboxylate transport system permease small subunit